MNSVKSLQARDPLKISYAERLEIKQLGTERPAGPFLGLFLGGSGV